MAGDDLNVWYDPEADHLEIVFERRAGHFEDTSLENVMRKVDDSGRLLGVSIFNLSSFAQACDSSPQPRGVHDVWAVYNLDIKPDNFELDIALAYALLHGSNPETTPNRFGDANERIRCRVFVHSDRSNTGFAGRPLIERKLEILSPDTKWIVSGACRDQLALALRLFKPEPFWMSPWDRRAEVRPFDTDVARYALHGAGITNFCRFAGRLLDFQAEMNRYWQVRYALPVLGPHLVPQAEDDPHGTKFLAQRASLMVATDLFRKANDEWSLSSDLRLVLLVMATEALFSDDDRSELSYKLATRLAVLNGSNTADRKRLFDIVRTMYEVRSHLMHGTVHIRKPSAKLRDLVSESKFIEVQHEAIGPFNNLVRASLLYFIGLPEFTRAEVLAVLDRAVFDPDEVTLLRVKANEYWGFPKTADELLCSNRHAQQNA